jgi:hypothetical protein
MQLGTYMRELWRLRFAVAICLLVGAFGGLSAFYKIGFFPPSIDGRQLEMATASTQVLVDTPRSTVLDLSQDTFSFQAMTNRAVLLGNVMASQPVLTFIGQRSGIAPEDIRASTPLTPDFPRPFATVGREVRTSDLLRSAHQYRLSIHANPTVPILEVVAQAPTAKAAGALANASVTGLRDYLASVAKQQEIAPKRQVTLEQLGTARGSVVNDGASVQAALVFFFAGFGIAGGLVLFGSRVRRGWRSGHDTRSDPPGQRPHGSAPAPRPRAEEPDLVTR